MINDEKMGGYYDGVLKYIAANDYSSYWTPALLNILKPKIASKVLDVGCGIGSQVRVLASLGCEVTGVDLSEKSLEVARLRCAYLGDKVDFIQGNIMEQEFVEEEFDYILICNSIEHFEEPVELFKHISKFLKDTGKIYIVMSNTEGWMLGIQRYIRGYLTGELAHIDELHPYSVIEEGVKEVFPSLELLEKWEFGEVYDVTGNKHHTSYEPFPPGNGLRGRRMALLYGKGGYS